MPHHELFRYALENNRNPLVYNGDIWTVKDAGGLYDKMKTPDFGLMLGRSAIANPALPREIRMAAGNAPGTAAGEEAADTGADAGRIRQTMERLPAGIRQTAESLPAEAL